MPRKRKHPDYEINAYRFSVVPVGGDVPQTLWDNAHLQQQMWNELVVLREEYMTRYLPLREEMDAETKRAFWNEFQDAARAVEQTYAPPERLGWENSRDVLDRFFVAHRRGFKSDAGKPKPRHRLERVRVIHRFSCGGWDIARITSQRANRFAFQFLPNARHYEYNVRAARNARLALARFQVGEESVLLRVNLHRQLPRRALVKTVALCGEYEKLKPVPTPDGKTRVQRVWTWHIVITTESEPAPRPPRSAHHAGLDVGWRIMHADDGDYIRIGYVVDDAENEIELRLPLDFSTAESRRLGYPCDHAALEQLQTSIALELESTKAQLRELGVAPPSLTQMRQRGLVRFTRELESLVGELNANEFIALERLREWRVKNDEMQRRYNRSAARFAERRRWLYRNLADWLTRTYGVIAWEGDLSVKRMAEAVLSEPEDRGLKAGMTYRQIAAIGEFRADLAHAAQKNGALLFNAKTAGSTTTCNLCGEDADAGAALYLVCPNGHKWDQDANAASNLLSQIPAGIDAGLDLRENGTERAEIPAQLRSVAVYVH